MSDINIRRKIGIAYDRFESQVTIKVTIPY